MQIDVFVHMLQHEPSEEKAQQHIGKIVDYLVAGWMSIFVACDKGGTHEVGRMLLSLVTSRARYRRFHPSVVCHASKMHDAASAHCRRQLCMG